MTDFLAGLPVTTLSGWSAFMLLSFAIVRAVVKGDFVPGARYAEERADHQELKKDYRELAGMIDTVLEQGATTVALLQSIRSAAEKPSDDQAGERP